MSSDTTPATVEDRLGSVAGSLHQIISDLFGIAGDLPADTTESVRQRLKDSATSLVGLAMEVSAVAAVDERATQVAVELAQQRKDRNIKLEELRSATDVRLAALSGQIPFPQKGSNGPVDNPSN